MSKVALMILSTHPHKKQDSLICYNGALHFKSVKMSSTHMLYLSTSKSINEDPWLSKNMKESF